jgi:hypothetical protein
VSATVVAEVVTIEQEEEKAVVKAERGVGGGNVGAGRSGRVLRSDGWGRGDCGG